MTVLLPRHLRLIVITDATLARPRSVEFMVEAALAAGAPAIQLRDKSGDVRQALPLARMLRMATRRANALLFVNDRLDLALAVGADGVHLGPGDLPVSAVRAVAPAGFLIGCSTDEPQMARRLEEAGADYIGCGAVWRTGSKEDADDEIGLEGLSRVVEAVSIPVVGIGGVSVERIDRIPTTGAAGAAVISAVMAAEDPGRVVRRLLAPWRGSDRPFPLSP
ncbi:MAG: thiamine phosphate synthase [Gemmatimonadota bacterium]